VEDSTEDVLENEMRGRIPAVFRKHKCRKENCTPVCDRVQQVQVVLSSIGYGASNWHQSYVCQSDIL